MQDCSAAGGRSGEAHSHLFNSAPLNFQPAPRLDLMSQKLLIPGSFYVLESQLGRLEGTNSSADSGLYLGHQWPYLENSIISWHEDTVNVYLQALRDCTMPKLEISVRRFDPSPAYDPVVRCCWWTEGGWIPEPPVETMPYAIPYTQYVECPRLEMWLERATCSSFTRTSGPLDALCFLLLVYKIHCASKMLVFSFDKSLNLSINTALGCPG